MYRPQFPFCPPPEDYRWEPVVYSFDPTNTPELSLSLVAGNQTDGIPLLLDSDADFYWCATRMVTDGLDVQLLDPFTSPLMDDLLPSPLYADAAIPTVMEPLGTFCPKGSPIWVKLKHP